MRAKESVHFPKTEHLHLRTKNNLKFWTKKFFFLSFSKKKWIHPVLAVRPFLVSRGLEGRDSSKSLSDPSSSGTSRSESESFTAKDHKMLREENKKLFVTQLDCVCVECVQFPYRNPSSGLAPPLSVCAAFYSGCFQLPGEHTKQSEFNTMPKKYHFAFICLGGGRVVTPPPILNFLTLVTTSVHINKSNLGYDEYDRDKKKQFILLKCIYFVCFIFKFGMIQCSLSHIYQSTHLKLFLF